MRICITGASGYLGSYLTTELVKLGHDLICVDMVSSENVFGEFRQIDLSKSGEVLAALEGAELLMHCASIHPWKQYTDEQYLDMNVKTTWNVFSAASELSIEHAILTSSIAVVGYAPDWEFMPIDESYLHPWLSDIYSITKHAQEMIARHFCGGKNMKVIALRPPNFTPKPPLEMGASLLSGCSVVEDVASAHLKALDVWEKMENNFESFYITQKFPYSREEERQLSSSPEYVLEKYFPGAYDWFLTRGITLRPSPTVYDNSKAKRILGWQPEYNFDRWFSEHKG